MIEADFDAAVVDVVVIVAVVLVAVVVVDVIGIVDEVSVTPIVSSLISFWTMS